MARLSALPRDSVVFTPGFFGDGTAKAYTPGETVKTMAASSAAPLYVPYETQIGLGVVGGVIPSFEAVGRKTGETVAALLEGRQAGAAAQHAVPGAPLVDARQIRRWGIDEDLLPRDTIVRFREPSLWAIHSREISIGLAVVLLQAALIAKLLLERRTRRKTASELAESEQRMNLAARAARLSMWIWDLEGDEIQMTTPQRPEGGAANAPPRPSDQALESVHPADRENLRRAVQEAIAHETELQNE